MADTSLSHGVVSKKVHEGQTLEEVRERERRYLAERRFLTERRHLAGVDVLPPGQPEAAARVAASPVGLALSGGGIRSATTNLGLLQAVARMDLLPHIDYLCTVSGGGYIGGCLSALLSVNDDPNRAVGSRAQYEIDSRKRPLFTTDSTRFPFRDVPGPWPSRPLTGDATSGKQEVKQLRTHGSFLVVRKGLFTTETLRSVGGLITGVVFHWILYLLAAAALAALCLVWTIAVLAPSVPDLVIKARQAMVVDVAAPRPAARVMEVKPASEAKAATGAKPPSVWQRMAPTLGLFGAASNGAISDIRTKPDGPVRAALRAGALVAVLIFIVVAFALNTMPARRREGQSDEDAFYRRLLTNVRRLGLAILVVVVLALRAHGEEPAQPLAWLLVPVAAALGFWITGFGLYVLLPWAEILFPRSWRVPLWSRGFRTAWGSVEALATYWVVAAVVLAAFPFVAFAVAEVTPYAIVATLASAALTRGLATRAGAGLPRLRGWFVPALKRGALGFLVVVFIALTTVLLAAWFVVAFTGFLALAVVAMALLCLVGIVGNSNKLALHYFYRDRLTETYLRTEAARSDDLSLELIHDAMDMRLKELHGVAPIAPPARYTTCVTSAPYLLISAAINLAERRDLTRKDRKSGYFVFSKLYCGSYHTSFRATADYHLGEVKLARAMTVSGAAVGSGMGYQTFFAQAFATTLFNLRLGYWMENPGKPLRMLRGFVERPIFSPLYLLREMLSWTHARGRLVNLSDGGHTGDNVGIYPLLQRRCRVIVACDAEEDAGLTFGSFTEALRHAFIDMNVDVDIDLTMMRPDPVTGLSRGHCAVGRIRYPEAAQGEPDPPQRAWLIYLKSSLTGDEPEPMKNYKVAHSEFPHESTTDQFFTDAQFESYRTLGDHLAEFAFGASFDGTELFSDDWLDALCARHSARSQEDDESHRRVRTALAKVERRLTSDPQLAWYYAQCYEPGPPAVVAPAEDGLAVTGVALQQLRLMEQAFVTLGLGRNPNTPDNLAWMGLFRRWARSPRFRQEFDRVRVTLPVGFVAFFDAYIGAAAFAAAVNALVPHPWDGRLAAGAPPIYLDPGRHEVGA